MKFDICNYPANEIRVIEAGGMIGVLTADITLLFIVIKLMDQF